MSAFVGAHHGNRRNRRFLPYPDSRPLVWPSAGHDAGYGVRVRAHRIGRLRAAAGALVLLGALTACGGDPDPVATDASSVAASSPTPTSPTSTDTESPSESATPEESPAVDRLDLSGLDLAGFTAQDGAIACLFDRTSGVPAVRCDVPDNSWAAPPKPRRCTLDWGHAVGLSADGSAGRFLCVGDTVLGMPDATDGTNELPAGTLASYDSLACLVQPDGVSCYDTASGLHSIFVTPLTYEVI